MTFSDVWSFLLPQWGDPLQMIFMVLMLCMVLLTIAKTHATAKPASWEAKWNRGTPDDKSDDLDIEHGSVTDLWQAVATWPEKLAEIMPGMLLVVGLLGTFLGLGLALNHASQILGSPNALSAGGAANSMHQLLGMLQGLGTKFKTSTWGITGFVILKIWSESTRFEEKRLTWVIGKVKTELEFRKKQAQQTEIAKQAALFTRIEDAAGKIVVGIGEQLAKVMEQDKQLVISSIKNAQKHAEDVCKALESLRDQDAQHHQQLSNYLAADALDRKELAERQLAATNEASAQIRDSQQQATKLLIDQLKNAGQQMLVELQHGTTQQEQQHATLLAHIDTLHHDLQDVQASACGTQQAMSSFTDSTQAIVEKMGNAVTDMAVGASQVGHAANNLVDAVSDFKTQFSAVLQEVREGLGAAIIEMSSQASNTLASGSAQLAKATGEISTALGVLSDDVKNTMAQVDTSTKKAQAIQEKASIEFTSSSKSLETNIISTTAIISKLARPIEDGLQSVSDVGSRLKNTSLAIDKLVKAIVPLEENSLSRLEALTKTLQDIPASQASLAAHLAPLQTMPSQLTSIQKVLDKLQSVAGLQVLLQQIVQQLSDIRQAPARQELLKQLANQLAALDGLKSVPGTLTQLADSLSPLHTFLATKGDGQPAKQVNIQTEAATT